MSSSPSSVPSPSRRLGVSLLFALGSALLFANLTRGDPSDSSTADRVGSRIAVVDLEKAFEAHPSTKETTAQLTKEREAARDAFKEKSEALKKVLQTHQELIRAGKRTEAAEKLKEANELEKAIATLRTTQQRNLQQRFVEEKHRIMTAIRETIRAYNTDARYAVVLDKSAESTFGIPVVIDASGAEDITAEIIERLGKETAAPDR